MVVSADSVQNPGNVYGMYLAHWFRDRRSLAHTPCSTGDWKEEIFLLDERGSTAIRKAICKHVCFFLICTAVVTGCLIFQLWVNMEANYSFICVELTLGSTHWGFVCLHYLDICHKSMRGARSGVQALQTLSVGL